MDLRYLILKTIFKLLWILLYLDFIQNGPTEDLLAFCLQFHVFQFILCIFHKCVYLFLLIL